MPQWGRIPQAAEYYGVTDKTIRRWIAAGIIEARRVGPRLILVRIESALENARPIGVVA